MNKLVPFLTAFKPTSFMSRYSFRTFGILDDMQSKLQKQFNPTALKVEDPNGDLYKVNVSK